MLYTNEKITKLVKTIFGEDLVSSVYINEKDDESGKDKIEQVLNDSPNSNSIQYNGCAMTITFKNGNIVGFTNTELASMQKLNK